MRTKKRKINDLESQLEIAKLVVTVYERRYNEMKGKYEQAEAERKRWEKIARRADQLRLEKVNGRKD